MTWWWMKSSWKHTLYLGPISKYAFTGYIRKWVSDKKSDRQKTVFSVHIEWPHLNSWAKQSSVVNKHGQKSMNMAIKMFSGLRLIETQRSKFGPIFCNKVHWKITVIKICEYLLKIVLLFLYSSMKKKLERFSWFLT